MTAKETWKPVTIGGLTGILMGAGAIYGVQAMTSSSNDVASSADGGLKVATVSDSMSFNHAFEAARAQVGAGGVFTWRGHIFNTYTEAEWKAMSHEDKRLFAEQVKPEISAVDVNEHRLANADVDANVNPNANDNPNPNPNTSNDNDDVQIAKDVTQPQDHDVEVQSARVNADNLQETTWNQLAQEENDVRIVGFKEIEIGRGRSITMEELDINGQRVAIIDVDKDGEPDLAMTDLNHNHQMDEGEVIDLHTGEPLSFTNDEPAIDNVSDIDTFTT